MDLVQWLRAQLDEDERIARAVQQPDDLRWGARHMAGEEAEGAVRWDVPGVARPTHEDPLNKARMVHIAEHDPARVLREIHAKRVMVNVIASVQAAALDAEHGCCHEGDAILAGECPNFPPDELPLLRLLALPYVDRPGFKEEWRP